MKLIKQDFNIVNQQGFSIKDIKKHIEYCARISYKSQDKITDDSYEKFVNMLVKKDHTRPLEFGTIHLRIPEGVWNDMVLALATNYYYSTNWIQSKLHFGEYFITTNYRYYLFLTKIYPEIEKYFTEEDNKLFPKRHTVHFVLSRGIMDEFRTHVGFSHIAESTRWINYNRGKFGNEITFIKPYWIDKYSKDTLDCSGHRKDGSSDMFISNDFTEELANSEATYLAMMIAGCKPQEARDILPLSVKSELISCGFEDAWSNFFYRRCAKDAHPMAREIAIPLQKRFKELGYVNQ